MNNAVTSANGTLSDIYGQESGNLDPYLKAGAQGVTSLSDALQPGGYLTKQFSFDPSDLENDPGYKFQLRQGTQAIGRNAAATGHGISGNLDTALSQYGQGLAGTTFNNAYNRNLTTFQTNRQNFIQPLSTLLNAGQTATGQFNSAAQNYGNTSGDNSIYGAKYAGDAGISGAKSIGDILQSIGAVKAGGSIAQGNIWGGLANKVGVNAATALAGGA